MKATLTINLILPLLVVIVVDLIALIFRYPTIYLGAFTLGWSIHDPIALIFKYLIIYVAAITLVWLTHYIILVIKPKH
jgi:hypothetical protein